MKERFKRFVILLVSILLVFIQTSSTYAVGTTSFSYTYDSNGRLLSMQSPEEKIAFIYDDNGNLLSRKHVGGFGVMTSPTDNQTFNSKSISISGWYLNEQTPDKVEVYVNNALIGYAIYGDSKESVYNQYPSYNNHNSGYHYSFTISTTATLAVFSLKVVFKKGSTTLTTYNRTFKYNAIPPSGPCTCDPGHGSS